VIDVVSMLAGAILFSLGIAILVGVSNDRETLARGLAYGVAGMVILAFCLWRTT
jgi:predicted cobalt transporter CbtA